MRGTKKPNYAKMDFENLALESPDELFDLLDKNCLDPTSLFLAIEALSIIDDRRKVILAALKYLNHPIPIIREAVIYVLSIRFTPKIKRELEKAYNIEQNDVIKSILKTYLGKKATEKEQGKQGEQNGK